MSELSTTVRSPSVLTSRRIRLFARNRFSTARGPPTQPSGQTVHSSRSTSLSLPISTWSRTRIVSRTPDTATVRWFLSPRVSPPERAVPMPIPLKMVSGKSWQMTVSFRLWRIALRTGPWMSRMETAPSSQDRSIVAGWLMETILAGQGVMWMIPISAAGTFSRRGRLALRILAAISRGGSMGTIRSQSEG